MDKKTMREQKVDRGREKAKVREGKREREGKYKNGEAKEEERTECG